MARTKLTARKLPSPYYRPPPPDYSDSDSGIEEVDSEARRREYDSDSTATTDSSDATDRDEEEEEYYSSSTPGYTNYIGDCSEDEETIANNINAMIHPANGEYNSNKLAPRSGPSRPRKVEEVENASEHKKIPKWILRRFNTTPDKIAVLELPCGDGLKYENYCRYLKKHAVDAFDARTGREVSSLTIHQGLVLPKGKPPPPKSPGFYVVPPKLKHPIPKFSLGVCAGSIKVVIPPPPPPKLKNKKPDINNNNSFSEDKEASVEQKSKDGEKPNKDVQQNGELKENETTEKERSQHVEQNGEIKQDEIEEEEVSKEEELSGDVMQNGDKESRSEKMKDKEARSDDGTAADAEKKKKNKKSKAKHEVVYFTRLPKGPPVVIHLAYTSFARTPHVLTLYALKASTLRTLTQEMINSEYKRPPPRVRVKHDHDLYTLEVENGKGLWMWRGARQGRSLESVILPKGQMEGIIADFREFSGHSTKSWYVSRGIPYRRTYLFHGAPGVGKTSTIRAIAGELRLPACFLSLGNREIGNKQLVDAMQNLPKPSVLVVEDVDAIFNSHREATTNPMLTFSGFINALDGMISPDGVLCVLTTNYPERLDPALARPGRIDRRFKFNPPGKCEIKQLFKSYYKDASDELQEEFAVKIIAASSNSFQKATNFATLQQHFIGSRKKKARECIDALPQFFAEFMAPSSPAGNAAIYS